MAKRPEAIAQAGPYMIHHGLWSEEEHERFLQARQIYLVNQWTQIARYVRTRNPRQVRSHAQKIQAKIARHDHGLQKIRKKVIRREHRLDGVLRQVPATSGISENATRRSSEPVSSVPPASQIETTLEFDHTVDVVDLHDCGEFARFREFLSDLELESLLEDDSC